MPTGHLQSEKCTIQRSLYPTPSESPHVQQSSNKVLMWRGGSHTLIYGNQRYTFSVLTPTGKPRPAECLRCQRATLRPSGVCQRKVKNSLFLIDFHGSYKGGGEGWGCLCAS